MIGPRDAVLMCLIGWHMPEVRSFYGGTDGRLGWGAYDGHGSCWPCAVGRDDGWCRWCWGGSGGWAGGAQGPRPTAWAHDDLKVFCNITIRTWP